MPRQPNIILIVSDQHRRDACGCLGSPFRRRDGGSPTPQIDALASRGVVFTRAYCPSPLCAPSRASYHTGLDPHRHGALTHKMLGREAGIHRHPGLRPGLPTLAERLRSAGYRTAAFGKVHVHGEEAAGWDLGFDERDLRFYTHAPGMHYGDLADGDINRRYRELSPYSSLTYSEIDPARYAAAPSGLRVSANTLNQHRLETLVPAPELMFDHLVADRCLDFVSRQHAADRPFFLHVGLEKPHEPWSVHQRHLDLFDPAAMPLPATLADWRERGEFFGVQTWQHHPRSDDPAFVRAVIASYHACVASMDEQVGRILARCAALGLDPSNTVFIYTSDHGELLFDHGLIYKHNFFESSVSVPLVLAGPGLPSGARSAAPASLVDLLPTLLDFASAPPPADTDGVSLRPAAENAPSLPETLRERRVFSEFHQENCAAWGARPAPRRMVRWRDYKFVYTHGCRDQLFDLAADPREIRDLATDPAQASLLLRLRHACLRDWRLDEHPALGLRARRDAGSVRLEWDSAGYGARYDVLMEDQNGDPGLLAAGVDTVAWRHDGAPTDRTLRYRVLARPALSRPFVGASGLARDGSSPVRAAHYPARLPISELACLPPDADHADVPPRLAQAAPFAGPGWTFQGVPPPPAPRDPAAGVELSPPLLLLSAAAEVAPAIWSGRLAALHPSAPRLRFVWSWYSPENYHAFEFDPAACRVRVIRRVANVDTTLAEHPSPLVKEHFGFILARHADCIELGLEASRFRHPLPDDVAPERIGLELFPRREAALPLGSPPAPECRAWRLSSCAANQA